VLPISDPSHARHRRALCLLFALFVCAHARAVHAEDTEALFNGGLTWEQFLSSAAAQREMWLKTAAIGNPRSDLIERFSRINAGLRILIVAEDWCADSVNVVPHIARLAAATSTPLRIIGRQAGAALMNTHRTPDGRTATPTIVLLRNGRDVAAWVERPALVQQWFLSMATDAESARRFGDRQSWYESDRGGTVLAELTVLAEQTVAAR
jgi:hypothetical protein